MLPTETTCAQEILEVVPAVMRVIRAEMRRNRGPDVSVPQFRAMLFIRRASAPSLTEVAEHLGLTLPSTSALVDGLVQRGLVSRSPVKGNRRQVQLGLTELGQPLLEEATRQAREALSVRLASLTRAEREQIVGAMELLRKVFQP